MKEKIARKLAEALESGDYCQEDSWALRRNINWGPVPTRTKVSVWGVLCNLHAQAFPEISKNEVKGEWYLGEFMFLPKQVAKWAGIKHRKYGKFFTEYPIEVYRYDDEEGSHTHFLPNPFAQNLEPYGVGNTYGYTLAQLSEVLTFEELASVIRLHHEYI